MKIVVSSDWHADWVTSGVARDKDVYVAVNESVGHAIRNEADAYFFLGDLADPDDPMRALRAAAMVVEFATELNRVEMRNYWLPGNHDVFEDGSGESTLQVIDKLPGKSWLLDVPGYYGDGDCNIIALPYTPTSHPYDPEETIAKAAEEISTRKMWGAPTIVLSHLAVPGAQPGEETTEMPRGREVVLPVEAIRRLRQHNPKKLVVLNGHYHRPQTLRFDGFEVHIPGSIQRLTHGEERNDPSFLVLHL